MVTLILEALFGLLLWLVKVPTVFLIIFLVTHLVADLACKTGVGPLFYFSLIVNVVTLIVFAVLIYSNHKDYYSEYEKVRYSYGQAIIFYPIIIGSVIRYFAQGADDDGNVTGPVSDISTSLVGLIITGILSSAGGNPLTVAIVISGIALAVFVISLFANGDAFY